MACGTHVDFYDKTIRERLLISARTLRTVAGAAFAMMIVLLALKHDVAAMVAEGCSLLMLAYSFWTDWIRLHAPHEVLNRVERRRASPEPRP
jgi:hypothetical protein